MNWGVGLRRGFDVQHNDRVSDVATPRATYRSVLADREFRAVFGADAISLVGDQVARIAVAVLVLDRTGSALAAAATYACSYLSWLVGGPVLSALADRLPRRATMIVSDLARAALVGLLVIPGVPTALVFLVLVVVGLLAPPAEAARSALLADMLEGDRYVAGNALIGTTGQLAQVGGFVLGGGLVALLGTHGALLVDAASFAASAALLLTVADRAVGAQEEREPFRVAIAGGLRVVVADRELTALLAWSTLVSAVTIAPEGLAVAIARDQGSGSLAAGVLTAAVPAGFVVGSWLLLRMPPDRRRRLFPWLALVSTVPLTFSPLVNGIPALAALWLIAGLGTGLSAVANSLFVQAVPRQFRGRAFGLASTSLMAVQGVVLLLSGVLAEWASAQGAVSLLALVGLALLAGAMLGTRRATRSGGAA